MISVSILSEKDNYKDAIKKINKTNADYLHLDIMDSTFTSNTSFSCEAGRQIEEISQKKLDIHIMSSKLDKILDEYIKLKPSIISIHYEAVSDIKKYIDQIKKNNIKVGLAINPDTNLSEIYPYLEDIDVVLVMGVIPGRGGQPFIENTTKKLESLHKMQKNYKYLIEVDGGINENTIELVNKYADIVVSGSFITKSDNYQEKISKLR